MYQVHVDITKTNMLEKKTDIEFIILNFYFKFFIIYFYYIYIINGTASKQEV
jgi:hypothetical protein